MLLYELKMQRALLHQLTIQDNVTAWANIVKRILLYRIATW